MANGNGTWKFIGVIATLIAIIMTVGGLIWNASTLSSELATNCKADTEIHPQIPRNQIAIAEVKKDIAAQERDLSRIEHKLDAQAAAQDALLEMQRQILTILRSQ